MRVIGYARCSSLEQAAEGISLDSQASRIEAWARAAGADLVDLVVDAGVSGRLSLGDRPEGARVAHILAARQSSADAVVVVRLDRLARDAAEALNLLRRFSDGPVGLVSIDEKLDLTTPQGRAMAGVAAVFAQLERELIAERTSEALAQLRAEGRVYGPTPYGFIATDGILVQHPEEQEVLKQILQLRSSGLSYRSIAQWLNAEAIVAKRVSTWSAASVRSVLMTNRQIVGSTSVPTAV